MKLYNEVAHSQRFRTLYVRVRISYVLSQFCADSVIIFQLLFISFPFNDLLNLNEYVIIYNDNVYLKNYI